MLYGAANDGMLHAFDASTGNERWAFVPSFVMSNMWKLADTDYATAHLFRRRLPGGGRHRHGTAGRPSWWAAKSGGKGYYALDITDPDNPAAMWEFTDANIGLSFGNPIITKRVEGTWVVAAAFRLDRMSMHGEGQTSTNAYTGVLDAQMSNSSGSVTIGAGCRRRAVGSTAAPNNTAEALLRWRHAGQPVALRLRRPGRTGRRRGHQAATFQISSGVPQPITTKPQLTVVTTSGATKLPVVVVATGRYLGTATSPTPPCSRSMRSRIR